MSKLHHFAHYVPVTSFPNEPVDRTRWPAAAVVGAIWGKGSSFEFSARLRFAEDKSGLAINLAEGEGTLPKKRVMLEAVCTVQQDIIHFGSFEFPPGVFVHNVGAIATDVSWKVSTILPRTYIGQAEPPIRTYDYAFDGISVA